MSTFQPDDCCGAALSKALRKGELDSANTWTHPKCGQPWAVEEIAGVRHWTPVCVMEVWR